MIISVPATYPEASARKPLSQSDLHAARYTLYRFFVINLLERSINLKKNQHILQRTFISTTRPFLPIVKKGQTVFAQLIAFLRLLNLSKYSSIVYSVILQYKVIKYPSKVRNMKKSNFLLYISLIGIILIIFKAPSFGQSANRLVMKYNKMDVVKHSGQTVLSKETLEKSGIIEFLPTQINASIDDSVEKFYIREISNESGAYYLRTQDINDDNFIFSIIKKDGKPYVVLHLIDFNKLYMLHISENFSLEIPMYNN